MSRSVKRKYDSSRRRAQAQETRQQIVAAARRLFIEQGYGSTTVAQVATAAGVAVETVYATFGNKATLLRHVWYVDFRGDEEDITLFDRPEMQAILAEPDLRTRIGKHAEFVTATNRRMFPLVETLVGAATEPGAEAMLSEWAHRRLDVATRTARAAAATGQLAIPENECRDVLFATMDGALWRRLVHERGWTDERYAKWLGRLWMSELLAESG